MEHAIGIASDHHSGGIVFQVNLDAGLTDRARWSFTCRLFLKASLPGDTAPCETKVMDVMLGDFCLGRLVLHESHSAVDVLLLYHGRGVILDEPRCGV